MQGHFPCRGISHAGNNRQPESHSVIANQQIFVSGFATYECFAQSISEGANEVFVAISQLRRTNE